MSVISNVILTSVKWHILMEYFGQVVQIVGAFWYFLALDRNDTCWQRSCKGQDGGCNTNFLYCGNQFLPGYRNWSDKGQSLLKSNCTADGDDFDFGIFQNALSSGIVSSKKFISKYCYCLWWGLQNLR